MQVMPMMQVMRVTQEMKESTPMTVQPPPSAPRVQVASD
jgi:hypothetical protein